MALSVSNMGAQKAYNAMSKLNASTEKAQLRIATQKKINSVADDTSAFNIGKALEAKVSLMKSAQKNVGSAKDLLATAETQLISMRDQITQIKAKIGDSGNSAVDLNSLQEDIKAIANEMSAAISNTKFNDTVLLGTTAAAGFSFQTGVSSSDTIAVDYADDVASDFNAAKTVIDTLSSASARADFTALETTLDAFESTVTSSLGKIGNFTQRLEAKDDFLSTAVANSEASIGRLFNADMAEEQLESTKNNIGTQISQSMFSQMNASSQQVLSLFR